MTVVEALAPAPGERVDIDGAELRSWLADRYRLDGGSWLRLNLVGALGGQSTGPSGTSEDLTGGIDRILLGVLRSSADVVLIGAGSLRGEVVALPRDRPLGVVTATGDLDADRLPEPRDGRRAMLLCPTDIAPGLASAMGERAEVVGIDGDPLGDPGTILRTLAARGLHRVVCEGGGVLAGRLLAAHVVDEFDQTIAPIAAAPGPPVLAGDIAPVAARLAGLLRDTTDRLYARWSFRPEP